MQESGLAMVNLQAKNVPVVFDIDPELLRQALLREQLPGEREAGCRGHHQREQQQQQITFRNIYCKNVPVLAKYTRSNTETRVDEKIYQVKSYDHGLQMDNLLDEPEYETLVDIAPWPRCPRPC